MSDGVWTDEEWLVRCKYCKHFSSRTVYTDGGNKDKIGYCDLRRINNPYHWVAVWDKCMFHQPDDIFIGDKQ